MVRLVEGDDDEEYDGDDEEGDDDELWKEPIPLGLKGFLLIK